LIYRPESLEVRPKPRHVIICEQCHSYYSVPHNLLPQGYKALTHVSVGGADSEPLRTNDASTRRCERPHSTYCRHSGRTSASTQSRSYAKA
jgi:hypothetical protein